MSAELKIPLDIPDVEIRLTEITQDGRLIVHIVQRIDGRLAQLARFARM